MEPQKDRRFSVRGGRRWQLVAQLDVHPIVAGKGDSGKSGHGWMLFDSVEGVASLNGRAVL
jgi:hypothetical protein